MSSGEGVAPPARSPSGREPQPPAAPDDVLQDQLADAWERLLGRTNIGVDDDFFALGGSAAMARQMLDDVAALVGVRPDVPSMAALTVRTLQELLLARLATDPVVTVQRGSAGATPLFLAHGDVGGGGYYVRALARGLGADQPVHALRQHGVTGDEVPPSIEAIAAEHLEAIAAVYPSGDVCLGGHCNGAIIALELASQLIRAGRRVSALVLIEPPLQRQPSPRPAPPRLSPELRSAPLVRGAWLFAEYRALLSRYACPAEYRGRVGVFRARDRPPGHGVQRLMEQLMAMAPHAEVYVCPGTHISALGRHVASMAAAIRSYLRAPTAPDV